MTIGLTYNNDLSRVEVALSDMADGTVQVQRVANASATDALWQRGVVRGAVARPIESGTGSVDDFEFYADVENFYRTVPVDPPAGLLLAGAGTDFASTPDDASLDITGDLDLRVDATADAWASGAVQALISKYGTAGDQRAYRIYVNGTGHPVLAWSTDGVGTEFRTATTPVPETSGRLALRATLDVDDGSSQHVVTFYTAPDITGSWTQLGTPVTTSGTTAIFASTADLHVGVFEGVQPFTGTIHAVQVRDGIDGTVVANPDFTAESGGTTSFTDSAGLVWSVNGDALIVGIETASITPSLDGKVWLKSIKYPALNRPVTLFDGGDAIGRRSRSEVQPVVGRSPGTGVHDQRLGRRFTLHLATDGPDHLAEAGEWDIILTAATLWFVHVPAGSQFPGGYVAIGDTSQQRLYPGSPLAPVVFDLPCTVEQAPAPQVTSTLLTAETVFRLYGSATALYAAHASGRSLLATVADPEDVVVI